MQNQVSAKMLVEEIIVSATQILSHTDVQRLIDLFILVDRLENRVQRYEALYPDLATLPYSLNRRRPQSWAKRVQMCPQPIKHIHTKN